MERSEGLSDFLRENSRQAREYEELCIDLLCLQAVRIIFQTYSHLMVFLLVLFLLFSFLLGLIVAACASPFAGSPVLDYRSAAVLYLLTSRRLGRLFRRSDDRPSSARQEDSAAAT